MFASHNESITLWCSYWLEKEPCAQPQVLDPLNTISKTPVRKVPTAVYFRSCHRRAPHQLCDACPSPEHILHSLCLYIRLRVAFYGLMPPLYIYPCSPRLGDSVFTFPGELRLAANDGRRQGACRHGDQRAVSGAYGRLGSIEGRHVWRNVRW